LVGSACGCNYIGDHRSDAEDARSVYGMAPLEQLRGWVHACVRAYHICVHRVVSRRVEVNASSVHAPDARQPSIRRKIKKSTASLMRSFGLCTVVYAGVRAVATLAATNLLVRRARLPFTPESRSHFPFVIARPKGPAISSFPAPPCLTTPWRYCCCTARRQDVAPSSLPSLSAAACSSTSWQAQRTSTTH
jgi:hypothetical protein